MNKSKKFSPEVRERAVRLVQEHRGEYPSLRAAIESIAPKIGCVPQTLLDWVKRHEIDSRMREGVTTAVASGRAMVRARRPTRRSPCQRRLWDGVRRKTGPWHEGLTAADILGDIDAKKLHSCPTLFAGVADEGSPFHDALARYFAGVPDPATVAILAGQEAAG
jgi:transposase-like protein